MAPPTPTVPPDAPPPPLFVEHAMAVRETRRQRSRGGWCIGYAMMSAPRSTHDQKIDNHQRIRERRQYYEMKDREFASFVRHFWHADPRVAQDCVVRQRRSIVSQSGLASGRG